MKKVMTYGEFELLDSRDIELFKQAKELGDYLVVVIIDDALAVFERSVNHRKEILEAVRYVDEVIIKTKGKSLEQLVNDANIALILIQKQWKQIFKQLNLNCEIIYN